MGLITAYATDAIVITPKGALQGSGMYDYSGSPVSTYARVSVKSGIRKDADGKDWMYRFHVWFKSTETITLQDQITFNGQTFEVRELIERDDITGILDHYEAYCG